MRILAVDDEPYILELMPLLAARVGFPQVTTASSGRLALEALADSGDGFDCLILDINMPEMDGIELCGRVRQIEAYRTTPIIMLTAMSERDYMDNAFKAGATDYATKPFDINELGARLRVAQELVLARRAAQAASGPNAAAGLAGGQPQGPALSDPMAIEGVGSFVDFFALKNYLTQSSRAGLAASQVIAVKIDGIEQIHSRSSAGEFAYALREVADAISEVMRTRGAMISHAGNGLFVIVSNSAAALSAVQIEADVQHLLDEKCSEYDNGDPMDIEVSIGNPIQPNAGDPVDAPRSVERAIARAESRSATKRDAPRGVSIRQVGR
jgi:CheY-like chemotaxis protein